MPEIQATRLPSVLSNSFVFTARAYAMAVLEVVILSVHLSICLPHAWIMTNLNYALQIFWYRTKWQSLCYSDTNSGWWKTPLPSEICAQSDPPFEKRRQISAYNVSTVRDSEKRLIMTNIKSTTGFPTSYRWSANFTPKSPKGWLKERFFSLFEYKSTADRLKRCQLRSPLSGINIWWSAAILITPTAWPSTNVCSS